MPTWSKLSPDEQKRRLDEIIRQKLRKLSTVGASVPIASAGNPHGCRLVRGGSRRSLAGSRQDEGPVDGPTLIVHRSVGERVYEVRGRSGRD
jgi:hypothetical protein